MNRTPSTAAFTFALLATLLYAGCATQSGGSRAAGTGAPDHRAPNERKDGLETLADGGWTDSNSQLPNPEANPSLTVNFKPLVNDDPRRWSIGDGYSYVSGHRRDDLPVPFVQLRCSGPTDQYFLPSPNPKRVPLTVGYLTTVTVEFGRITSHPVSQTVDAGAPVTFRVTAQPPRPSETDCTYQWYRRIEGRYTAIPGETRPDYSIASATAASAGQYKARVRWNRKNLWSTPATLRVR